MGSGGGGEAAAAQALEAAVFSRVLEPKKALAIMWDCRYNKAITVGESGAKCSDFPQADGRRPE